MIFIYAHFYGRELQKIHSEMKKKLTPQQFDVWLEIQRVEREIERMEREDRNSAGLGMFCQFELRELREKKNELWSKFSELGGR